MASIILHACLRVGVLLSLVGAVSCFAHLDNVMLGFILLGLIALHLMVSMWTANKPTSYNTYRQCFVDIAGDITGYTCLLLMLFVWVLWPYHVLQLPMSVAQYWLGAGFLLVMCLITLFEMIVTIRSCLIALERQNPVSLAPPTA